MQITVTAKQVWDAQRKAEQARVDASNVYEQIYFAAHPSERGDHTKLENHPDLKAARAEADRQAMEVEKLQDEIGGKVYRIPGENLSDFEARIAKLNKKAAKINVSPIEVRTLETEEEVKEVRDDLTGETTEKIFTWTYVAISGEAPRIAGWTFLAALDHTIQDDKNDMVTINRVPSSKFDHIDLTKYRHAPNRCDHCGYTRQRNQTYVVFNSEKDELLQVGSNCLKDFTGHSNPHSIARWAEFLAALDRDLSYGGEHYGTTSGRDATEIRWYLANVATCIRHYGYTSRWRKTDYGENERNSDNSADAAWGNLLNYGKKDKEGHDMYVEVTEEDRELAEKGLAWVREIAEKDELDEFEHNLVAATNSDYMPKKGDGFVAYVVRGYMRQFEKEQEAKRPKAPLPITDEKVTVTGQITSESFKPDYYGDGTVHKMTVRDDRGFRVWGTVPKAIEGAFEIGKRVKFDAKLNVSDDDETFGFFKRPTKAEIIEEEAS